MIQVTHSNTINWQASNIVKTTTHSDVLASKCLQDKIGHHPAIITVHARTISVEDARHPHGHIFLLAIRVSKSLGHSLGLIVASTGTCKALVILF